MFHLTLRSSFSQSLTHKAAIFPSLFTGVFEKDMPGVWFIFDSYICSRHGLEISGAFSELAHVLVLSLSALYVSPVISVTNIKHQDIVISTGKPYCGKPSFG